MKIKLTKHASFQIKIRNLTRQKVTAIIKKTDLVLRQSAKRFRAVKTIIKSKKKFLLIVIYDQNPNDIEIMTAFITSKIKKYESR